MTRYEEYQLKWMIDHGYTAKDLVITFLDMHDKEELEQNNISDLFESWAGANGFQGEIWAGEKEWRMNEGKENHFYKVIVKETSTREIAVEACSREEAYEKAEYLWNKSLVVLDNEDFDDVEYIVKEKIEEEDMQWYERKNVFPK